MLDTIAITSVTEIGVRAHETLTQNELGSILVALRNHILTTRTWHANVCADKRALPTICGAVNDYLRQLEHLDEKLHRLIS